MNLYGENGNVKCLKQYLENQNIKVTITYLSKDDNINFNNYDIFYIGSGNDENFLITLEDLKKYTTDLKNAINNKFFIVTGNALNLFGKKYLKKDNEIQCLDVLNYSSKDCKKRFVGEQLYKTPLIKEEIIGFENRQSMLIDVKETTLFESIKGFGNSKHDNFEGIKRNNFYGTYLLGPLLIRNPYFTNYLTKQICNDLKIEFKEMYNDYELKAYENYKNIIKEKH
jgi:hypothetical protein